MRKAFNNALPTYVSLPPTVRSVTHALRKSAPSCRITDSANAPLLLHAIRANSRNYSMRLGPGCVALPRERRICDTSPLTSRHALRISAASLSFIAHVMSGEGRNSSA